MKHLKIGKLKLANPLVLAPMVDVTDLPFRLLCRRAGASLAFTEMVYVNALVHENAATLRMVKTCEEDLPLGLQITGSRVEEFEEFVRRKKLWKKFDLIDLNCGCPSTRIVGSEAGSYLLKDLKKIVSIIKILRKTGKPITVKVRLGFSRNNILEIARAVEKAGASAITIHCRCAVDGNDVPANWSWLKKVKKEIKISVIGNGDIFSGEDAERMLQETGCDGVMIGRGAIGNPLIFSEALECLDVHSPHYFRRVSVVGAYPPTPNYPSKIFRTVLSNSSLSSEHTDKNNRSTIFVDNFRIKENMKMFEEYLKLEKKYFGVKADFGKIKYVGGKFLRGFVGAARAREEFMKLKGWNEILAFIKKIK